MMPANVVKSKSDELKWKRAKTMAKNQEHAKDWPYVMSIYQSMQKGKKTAAVVDRMAYDLATSIMANRNTLDKEASLADVMDKLKLTIYKMITAKRKYLDPMKPDKSIIGWIKKLVADSKMRKAFPAQYKVLKAENLFNKQMAKTWQRELGVLSNRDADMGKLLARMMVENQRMKTMPYYLDLLKVHGLMPK